MQESPFFASSLEPPHARFLLRLGVADGLDMALGGLLGWGSFRLNDIQSTPGQAAVVAGVWVIYATLCGAARRTVGRWLCGVDLLANGKKAPGPWRSFLRAFTVLPDVVLAAVIHFRPLDQFLGLSPEREAVSLRRWVGLFTWQAPWVVLLAVAIQLILSPTRSEALSFLITLDGWRCCHARGAPTRRCTGSLERVILDAHASDAKALEVVARCPEAARKVDSSN